MIVYSNLLNATKKWQLIQPILARIDQFSSAAVCVAAFFIYSQSRRHR